MAAQQVEDFVTVYESSDGGGTQVTFWQLFVGTTPVGTRNPAHAETARLAITVNKKVKATYDDGTKLISQLRLQLAPVPPSH